MKRSTFFVLFMAVAVVVACQKISVAEEEIPENQTVIEEREVHTGSYVYTINALIPETKSDYDNSGNFSWSEGDAISVLFHKDTDNKFFTLTRISGTGADATFRGTIDEGYTIGASDQTVSDKKIWALFPASTSHTYTTGSYPSFYTPSVQDYTAIGAHFSANLPMYAHLESEGDITFSYLASAYKFTVTDLDASVNKVKMTVYNQQTHGLSGLFPLTLDGEILINFGWTAEGTAERTLTQTVNKSGSSAVFYVPFRWYGNFKPEIIIYNAENNNTLKHVVATNNKVPTSKTAVQPITISASGTGTEETIGVNWAAVPADHTFTGGNSRVSQWKAASDDDNIYFQYTFAKEKFKKNGSSKFFIGFNTDNDAETGGVAGGGLGSGYEAMVYFYPWTGGASDGNPDGVISGLNPYCYVQAPIGTTKAGVKVVTHGTIDGSNVLIEVAIPRSSVGISSGTNVAVRHSTENYLTVGDLVSL